MTYPVANNVYGIANGTTSTAVFITVFFQRNPTSNDVNYLVTQRWVNTLTAKEFILTGFTSAGGFNQAVWLNITNGVLGALDELTGNSGTNPVLPDGSNNINILGDTTSIQIVGSSHTLTANVILPSTDYEVLVGRVDSISGVTPGTTGQVLVSQGSSALPIWQNVDDTLTVGPFGSSPNADAATFSGGILTLEPCDATHPGGIALGSQTFGSGTKTFTSSPILPLTGVVIGNGASALTASTITQHDVLVGGTSNAITSISPSTLGFVLTSNGAGADPSFQATAAALTLTAFGSTPNADAASLSGGALTLQPASGTEPGGIALGAQTLGSGVKTLTSPPILNGLTGVLTGNNATAVTASAITQHDVLVGGASNLITSVSPGVTAGIPLVANASGDPSFSTALIAGGGTASTSFPIHGTVISGATTTSALSSLTMTDGQIIIGATGAAPTAASITAGTGITVTPGTNSITISSTNTGFVWLPESTSFSAVAGHGYIITGVGPLVASLPNPTPAIGDTIAFIVRDSATSLSINSGTNVMQIGTSGPGFNCANTAIGDSITFVFVGNSEWLNYNAPQGVWVLS